MIYLKESGGAGGIRTHVHRHEAGILAAELRTPKRLSLYETHEHSGFQTIFCFNFDTIRIF